MRGAKREPDEVEALAREDVAGETGDASRCSEEVAPHRPQRGERLDTEDLLDRRRAAEPAAEMAPGVARSGARRQDDAVPELPAGQEEAVEPARKPRFVRVDDQRPRAGGGDALPHARRRGERLGVAGALRRGVPLERVVQAVLA